MSGFGSDVPRKMHGRATIGRAYGKLNSNRIITVTAEVNALWPRARSMDTIIIDSLVEDPQWWLCGKFGSNADRRELADMRSSRPSAFFGLRAGAIP